MLTKSGASRRSEMTGLCHVTLAWSPRYCSTHARSHNNKSPIAYLFISSSPCSSRSPPDASMTTQIPPGNSPVYPERPSPSSPTPPYPPTVPGTSLPVFPDNAPAPAEHGALRTGAHYASLVLSAMLGTLIRLGFNALGACELVVWTSADNRRRKGHLPSRMGTGRRLRNHGARDGKEEPA